jgi:hypothetical protein
VLGVYWVYRSDPEAVGKWAWYSRFSSTESKSAWPYPGYRLCESPLASGLQFSILEMKYNTLLTWLWKFNEITCSKMICKCQRAVQMETFSHHNWHIAHGVSRDRGADGRGGARGEKKFSSFSLLIAILVLIHHAYLEMSIRLGCLSYSLMCNAYNQPHPPSFCLLTQINSFLNWETSSVKIRVYIIFKVTELCFKTSSPRKYLYSVLSYSS